MANVARLAAHGVNGTAWSARQHWLAGSLSLGAAWAGCIVAAAVCAGALHSTPASAEAEPVALAVAAEPAAAAPASPAPAAAPSQGVRPLAGPPTNAAADTPPPNSWQQPAASPPPGAAPSSGIAPLPGGNGSDAVITTLNGFSQVRTTILDLISGATRRIWLSTDYLTDGEIVSALYVAQYRKIDVQVLLGRGKANLYMSRLNYLKNQNIPVYLRPDTFKTAPTAVLVDDQLLYLDAELDFLAKVRRFTVSRATGVQRDEFATNFSQAASLKVPALARPLPLVGRPGGTGRTYAPPAPGGRYLPSPTTVRHNDDPSGVYRYDRTPMPRPDDVPKKLPKALKWENRAESSPAPEASPSPAVKALETPKTQ